ncbi:MAG: hypothetical protein OXM55_03825 [Bdellovibrionales bacterium]|nr:hypothetical protein [Bdellovibrionales bacterium]
MDISQLREHLTHFQFNKMFEVLGWEHPTGPKLGEFKITGHPVSYSVLAEISSVPVLKFSQDTLKQFESNSARKKFHKELKNQHHKHLALFSDEENFFSLSYLSKEGQVRTHSYFKGQNSDYFISKLAGIHFGIEDEPNISEIGNKLEKAFDTEEVTKRFFENFKSNHNSFLKYIDGIKSEEEKKWFASLILNRLMFIWFLQKKGFVNTDFYYLETKLNESKKRGKDRYYSEFLTLLFFEGFAKKPKERSNQATKLLGKIKYLNGGLFVPHPIEEKYKNKIKVQDKAFDETFVIFRKYNWSLQGKEGKSDNEISPDIMGYIFEKYINELQQKSLGAYYTRDEITSYLSRTTIQKCVLEKVNNKGYKFETIADMLHKRDAPLCKLLLTNEDSILNTLTVLDPAVGSGAFLVSAMKELIDIYSPIIGKIETLADRDLTDWLKSFKEKNKSALYGIKKNIILKNLYGVDIMKEATEVCKLRLFLSLVSSALKIEELEPLPNMDFNIMCGNSLIGFLKEAKQAQEGEEQLKWDAVLGESYQQIKDRYNRMVNQYKNKALSFEKLKELKYKISNFMEENNFKLNRVLADKCKEKGLKYSEITDIQGKKKIFGKKRFVLPEDFSSKEDSRNLKPFHWDFAFNEIMNKGGFDIIITNPPWEKVKTEDREFFHKYDKSIDKKKTKKEAVKKKKKELLKQSEIKQDYLKTEEFYQFQRDYFSKLYQYQSGKIININGTEKQASADMDTYRLFTERCFELLVENGFFGIVLPSGLHKDDGAIGLRRELLFKKAKIEGLIDFQNQMSNGKGKIFEGVHPQLKFLLLNLKKDKPQDEFPCQFMERDLNILNEYKFPKNPSMKQSINEIRKLSPRDCSIIEFKTQRDIDLFKKTSKFPMLGKHIDNLWNPEFYSELHEKNDSHLFKTQKLSDDHLPLYKGEAIYQYEFNHNLSYVNRHVSINSKKVRGKGFPFKNKCYKNYRLVIRTVASNTNERSLISAVIPKNRFFAHSLHGTYIGSRRTIQKNKYMLVLQVFLNSFVVDYLIRKRISANITQNYIKSLKIPRLTEKDPFFKELVERSAKLTCIGKEFNELADEVGIQRGGVKDEQERWRIQGEIDAIVAYVYGLNLDEFEYILSTFTTGKNQERLQTLKKHALAAFKKRRKQKSVSNKADPSRKALKKIQPLRKTS